MSVLNKKPFIQLLLDTLSSEEKSALLNCINGATSVRKYSLVQRDLSVSTPIESIQLETKTKIYNGYKIYKSDKITFLMYNIGQEINIYQVDYPYYEKELKGRIRESLSIEELRRYLESGEGGVGETVTVGEIDSEEAEAGKVIVSNGEGGAVWGDASAGLPESTKADQVLVSNDEGGWDEKKSAPLADNLLADPENNDSPYSSGPTGGSLDIATGEEAYLQEIKGLSLVWNQLLDADHSSYTCESSHIYAHFEGPSLGWTIIKNSTSTISYNASRNNKLFDLTLMFGGSNKIPFSTVQGVEYPENGTLSSQNVWRDTGFQRFFANVPLFTTPYDAGTVKNVKATKLVETGRNLWDASTMDGDNGTGLQLLASYRYEIYLSGNATSIQVSRDDGVTWGTTSLSSAVLANGKTIWYFTSSMNCLIKSLSSQIRYVGFVHSGNYCLGTGTYVGGSATTTVDIPSYIKYEFSIDGIDGLNGLLDDTGKTIVYDTKDYTRVSSIDLSTLSWTQDGSVYKASITGIKPSTTSLLATKYIDSEMSVDSEGVLSITTAESPTGTLLFELETPVATGESAFEPIALKSGDTWVVDDMGSEYFIQPANTNCPVNQVSYYYPNLKDKLVNLNPIKVEAIDYNANATPLSGLNINDVRYKMVPMGSGSGFALGPSSYASSGGGIAIGQNSINYGNNAVAIGVNALTKFDNMVCFDSTSSNKSLFLFDLNSIIFRFENNSYLTRIEYYKKLHYLTEYVQNQALVLQDGKYYISYTDANNFKTFSNNRISGTDADITSTVKGVHLIVKLSNNVVASLDLLPYDSANSQAFTAYGIASDTPSFVSAYIDSDGCVVITAPSGLTVTEALYTLR